ncbi:MAG: alpha-2-macroglobulin family protein [Saprospiraceae bacterium]
MNKSNNMRILFLLIFFFGKMDFGFSQKKTFSDLTSIYKITANEAKTLFQKKDMELTDQFFHTPIDTFSSSNYKRAELNGHYLFVKAIGSQLHINLKSYNSIHAIILNNQRDLALQVIDSLGNTIENAQIFLGKKQIPFDQKTKSYRKRKKYKGGFLTIKVNDETLFYFLNRKDRTSIFSKKWKRFRSTKIGRVLIPPYYFKNSKATKGYIVLNKPKFQPGDTVKIKAYFTNHKGKPFKRKLQLNLVDQDDYHKRSLHKIELSPTTPGAYLYEFVLNDSLSLDKYYHLNFSYLKRKKKNIKVRSHYFYYEDYQLDEVDYFFSSKQDEYSKGEPIILFAEGKDKNGWTIPYGRVDLTATRGEVDNFYKNEISIPDTLWKHTQVLDSRGETQILFPFDILPKVKMDINVEAKFSNSNGELQTENIEFIYDDLDEKIIAKIEDGFVVAEYFLNGKSVEKEVELWKDNDEQIDQESIVKLPYKARINPFYSYYSFDTDKAEAEIDFDENIYGNNSSEKNAGINLLGNRTADSIFTTIINPHRIPINYQIRTKNNILTEGVTEEKIWNYQLRKTGGAPFFVYYQYVWGGESYEKEASYFNVSKLLTIETDQPSNVQPGEQIQVKVTVKDQKEKPRKNVNLAAGAINGQFEILENILEPAITQKKPRNPRTYNSFNLVHAKSISKVLNLSPKWNRDLQLSKYLFYRLRYPKDGFHMEFDSITVDTFYQDIPQFSPYLVKDGKDVPIYLIYCNRQLVYYYGVNDLPPYSFVGQEGMNQIVIRGRDFIYTVDSVLLKPGHKLELSIDVNNFAKSSFSKNIKIQPANPELSRQEKVLLRRKILHLRNYNSKQKNYVWQGTWNIHQLPENSRYNIAIGPFLQMPIQFLERDGWNNQFEFEPGYTHVILKGRERLYQNDLFPLKKKIVLPKKIAPQYPGAIIYSPKQIEVKSPLIEKLGGFKHSYSSSRDKGGTYQFNLKKNDETDFIKFAIVLLENDTTFTVYNNYTNKIHNLEPKDYSLIIFSTNGNYIKKEFTIQRDTFLYQDLSDETIIIDSSQILFNKIFTAYLVKYQKENGRAPSPQQTIIPRYDYLGDIGIHGKISDKDTGEDMIAANIVISQNGTFISGETTDIDGNYSIKLPYGTYDVEISYTGYPTQKITGIVVTNIYTKVDVQLSVGVGNIMEEIVVTGYKIPLIRADDFGSGSILPSRNIRGMAAQSAGISSYDSDAISIKSSRSNSTDYYIDGIRVRGNLLPESENNIMERSGGIDAKYGDVRGGIINFDPNNLRSDFSDYAYFQPNLITDQNGEAYFNVTFPDNITAWKTYVVGMDNKLRAGTIISEVRAFKKITAQLALPRFLVKGDKTNIIGKSINYTLDSFQVTTAFKIGDEILKTNESKLKNALIEKAEITTPENSDSLTLSYLLRSENYGDGEERSIPIFPKGVKQTNGAFTVLDRTKSWKTSFSPEWGEVTLRIEDNILNSLLEDVKYLRNYPYGCNEQTASRLIALLLEKDIKKYLGEEFDGEKEIIKTIRRLKKTQNENGSWGWWKNGKQNIWMTTYVLSALEKAKQANYKTEALNKGLVLLTNYLEEMKGKDLMNTLSLFSDINQNLDYQKYLTQLDSTQHTLYDKFSLIKICQAQGLPYSIDSVMQHKKEDLFAGWHFGEDNYQWYNNSTKITLLAYDIFKNIPSERSGVEKEEALKNIRQYFYSRRKSKYGWRNTISTAKILAAILPELMDGKNGLKKNEVKISGILNQTVSDFPFETTISLSDAQALNITKLGETPIFITAYQEFWNRNPEKKENNFAIKTHLLQNGKKTNDLKAAVAADLLVNVEVKKSAEYVMIEIPIPAGCSYREKPNNYWNRESHREYFKNRVAIFCENLPEGKYTFSIPLEPRFSGTYTLNPTKAEQMYFPIFYGRNEMRRMTIK